TFLQSDAQIALPLLLAGYADLQVFVEYFVAPAARLLGAIHGKIRVADEHFGCRVVRSGHGRADTGAGLDDVPKNVKGTLDLLQNAAGDNLEIVWGDNVLHQNGELVSSQPRGRVLGAQRGAEPSGNRHQQNIARGVAQHVVDFLKAVKVNIEHAAAMIGIAHASAERQVEPVKKQRPVGQSRHHVVHGVVLQLGF